MQNLVDELLIAARAYGEAFQVFDKNTDTVMEMHKKYPFALPAYLKDRLRKEHIQLIYPLYHGLLNEFLSLKFSQPDLEKERYFKLYANDFQKQLETSLLK